MNKPTGKEIIVSGIVARRDMQPYVQILNEDGIMLGQLTIAQAHSVARDLVVMAARTEADAMICKFFQAKEFPEGAADAILVDFRDFRHQLDVEPVERGESNPDDLGER
jgi:hypothetical protein